MKFPKLKHSVLCQILLYLPAFSFFLVIWLLSLLSKRMEIGWIALLYPVSLVFSVWYLIAHFPLFLISDALFAYIRSWKRDRLVYRCPGEPAEAVEARLARRCRLWGRRWKTSASDLNVYYRHGVNWTSFWSGREKRIAICRTGHLDAASYRQLLGRARRELSRVPDGKHRLRRKAWSKEPRVRAYVVVILADSVDEAAKALPRMHDRAKDEFYVLPCVVDCPAGACYLDVNREYFEAGMSGRPAKNIAAAMARRLVFGGILPKEDRGTQPEYDARFDPEMSLWEYARTIRKEMLDEDIESKKERKKMLRHLRDGEVRMGEGAVYCKLDGRLAEYVCLPDEDDDRLLTLLTDDCWYYLPEKNAVLTFFVPWLREIRRRKMKIADRKRVREMIEARLTADGWRIAKDG